MGLKGGDDVVFDDGSKSVSCSICLEVVSDCGDRSWAKLHCGHEFHLDCIGSAFNAKGSMQCPNCRRIEKGQWLYANGCRAFPEFSMDDWAQEENVYDLSYSEMSFGVHWCPFGHVAGLPSSFEDGEFTTTAYHDPLAQSALFAEHSAVTSAAHPCPYIAYFGPIHPSSSAPNVSISDASNVNNHWNGPSAQSEGPGPFVFPALNLHYHSLEHNSPPFSTSHARPGGPDPPSVATTSRRSLRTLADRPTSGSFMHPFVASNSAGARTGNSIASSQIPPYPGSNARNRDRVQALQAYYQQQRPNHHLPSHGPVMATNRISLSHRGLSDQPNNFYFFPAGSSNHNFQEPERIPSTGFHLWERGHLPALSTQVDRDSAQEGFRAGPVRTEPGLRHGTSRHRQGFGRTASDNGS
ncbi:hypothetical protein SAY87_032112 [Trapa incisa]|uniref:RING-type domain-containing protein n=1 Tax=Trapa incisa TaxID=236973 RepID=A0AAN7KX75_9MYRT|nr:hypothetical protein SAY87_032112 [Trapa incisa]